MRRLLELSGWIILLLALLATWPAERIIFAFSGYYFFYGIILGLKYEKVDEMFLVPNTILIMIWAIAWPFLLISQVIYLLSESFSAGLRVPFA